MALLTISAFIVIGCGSSEVKAEDVKSYQEAGRTPGDPVERATTTTG